MHALGGNAESHDGADIHTCCTKFSIWANLCMRDCMVYTTLSRLIWEAVIIWHIEVWKCLQAYISYTACVQELGSHSATRNSDLVKMHTGFLS